MPAASWRSMPARNISRCDTISASFGVSFRMGRKYRDNRMGTLGESGNIQEPVSETGSDRKTQEPGPLKEVRRPPACRADDRQLLHFHPGMAVVTPASRTTSPGITGARRPGRTNVEGR